MSIYSGTITTLPTSLQGKQKRNVVKTPVGWVRQGKRDGAPGEIIEPIANTAAFSTSTITDMWYADADGSQILAASINSPVSVFVSYNQPIQSLTTSAKISVANTAGGSAKTATTDVATVVEGNKLKFVFTPTVAGTYKVQAQTMANGSTGAISIRSTTGNGNTAVSLVISGTMSNTASSIVAS